VAESVLTRRRRALSTRLWQILWVRLAVALAFADASIVVLALPQLVDQFHTSISHVVWVIVAYNLALIAGSVAILLLRRQLASTGALVAGLIVFGLASLGCGASNSLAALVPLRCVQGVGGALVLCASLPLFAGAARPGESPLYRWSAAAAIGAAIGPAAGGVLTELFSWRAIFFAQAPVAALAAVAVLAGRPRVAEELPPEPSPETSRRRAVLDPVTANVALAFLSAGLIGALFLVVIELINGWLVTPIGAAAIVSTLPIATALAQRAVPGRFPVLSGAAGSVLLAAGLFCLSQLTHRELGLVILALALCGAGLGLGFLGLTAAALGGRGSATARAARTIAARDAGLVLGLLVLTPVFVNQLNAAPDRATRQAAGVLIISPLPTSVKLELAPKLQQAAATAPQSRPPDIGPAFDQVSAGTSPADRVHLATLERQINAIIQRSVTHAFRRPFLYAALLSLLVLPLLALRVWSNRAKGLPSAGTSPRRTA
jgi:predicted MFS family arabinose efflux permease